MSSAHRLASLSYEVVALGFLTAQTVIGKLSKCQLSTNLCGLCSGSTYVYDIHNKISNYLFILSNFVAFVLDPSMYMTFIGRYPLIIIVLSRHNFP